MIIKKLILHKYKRFFLTGIETLTYEPEKTMQIIVSKNGAGKSSLLQELNPLPADIKKNYYEDGYKYIEISHYGKLYQLRSGTKHSMIVDGVELNPGGTRKVQLELVKEYFGITPAIVDILLNINRLTTMPIFERKKWISEISTIDYTYPISIYNKLKSEHRDILGGIKLLENEVIALTSKKLNKETIEDLKQQKKYLTEYMEHIISLYQHIDYIDINSINNINNSLQDKLSNIRWSNINRKDIIEEKYKTYKEKQEILKNEINTTVKIIDDLEKIIHIEDPVKHQQLINKYHDEIGNILKDLDFELDIPYIKQIYEQYGSVSMYIKTELNSLVEYDKVRFMDREEQKYKLKERSDLEYTLNIDKRTKDQLEDKRRHLSQSNTEKHDISCPNCSYTFQYDNKEMNLNSLDKQIDSLNKKIEQTINTLKPVKELCSLIEEKDSRINAIKVIMAEHPDLKPIWLKLITKFDLNKDSIEFVISQFDHMLLDLERWSKATDLDKEIKRLTAELREYENIKQKKENSHLEKISFYKDKLNKLTEEHNECKSQVNQLSTLLEYVNEITSGTADIKNKLDLIKDTKKKLYIQTRNKYLKELKDDIENMLLEIDSGLNRNHTLEEQLEYRQKKIEEYKLQERSLSAMVKALSPTEGLIAKSINSFLKVFVKEMNSIINRIWSYDLEILPCEIGETDDLDYKFKVKVNNDQIIDDVSRLSTGMKEIVDLAFRIVFAKYKGFKEIPLYLDEFGHGFDKNHRTVAYNVIDKILSSDYPQVFIVCHYESLYGSFKNVDFNVLDGSSDNSSDTTFNNKLKLEY